MRTPRFDKVEKQELFLDIYRIIAAMFVIFGHSFSFYELTMFKNESVFPYLQNIGVVMFFILSGYLTTYSLNKKNKNNDYRLIEFVKHKYIRIIQEYIPALLMIVLLDAVLIINNSYPYKENYSFVQFFGNLFMLQGTIFNKIPGVEFNPFGSGRPLWTLSIEWWFYIIFAFLFLSLVNNKRLSLKKIVLLAVCAFIPCEYYIGSRGGGLGIVFCLGVLAYYIYDLLDVRSSTVVFIVSIISYVIYGIAVKNAYTIVSFIILWFIFCSGLNLFQQKTKIRHNIISYVSKSTFLLYLTHYTVIEIIRNIKFIDNLLFKFIIGIILSLCMALLMYYCFGKKQTMLNSWKRIKQLIVK